MNILTLRIGVFFEHSTWADKFKKLCLKDIPPECIRAVRKSELELINNTTIRFMYVDDETDVRGCRFDRVVIEPSISDKNREAQIYPRLSSGKNLYEWDADVGYIPLF